MGSARSRPQAIHSFAPVPSEAYLRDGQIDDAVALARRASKPSRPHEPMASCGRQPRAAAPPRRTGTQRSIASVMRPTSVAGATPFAFNEDFDVEGAWCDAQPGTAHWISGADSPAIPTTRSPSTGGCSNTTAGAHDETIDFRAIRESLVNAGRSSEFEAELLRIRSEHSGCPKLSSTLAAQDW